MTVRVDRDAKALGRDLALVITRQGGAVRVVDRRGVVIPVRVLRRPGVQTLVLEPR